MNIQKLNEIVEDLKEDCGKGLLATDIYAAADGQPIAGYNSNPKGAALANRQRTLVNQALRESNFPELNRYFLLHLEGGLIIINMSLGDYQWGMLFDENKIQLGLLLNVIVPKTTNALLELLSA